MKLPDDVTDMVLTADAKALSTIMENAAHVVPVSTVKMVDNEIMLVNYFMGQTLKNIQANSRVSLTCWKGLNGYQIKATAAYLTEGDLFNKTVIWIREILPTRVVKGLLLLTPYEVYDVSATIEHPGSKLI